VSSTVDELIRRILDELPVGIWVARAETAEVLYANETYHEITGVAARSGVKVGECAEPYTVRDLDGAPYPHARMPFARVLAERQMVVCDDVVVHRADGGRVNLRILARPLLDGSGQITHVAAAFFDISREVAARRAQQESERRLASAQRLESIGTLAGGVAHDFNNLLTVIECIASVLITDEPSLERRRDLQRITEVSERAAQLTRGLLGFAGRGRHRAERTSLNAVVGSLSDLIGRTIGQRYEFSIALEARGSDVEGDASQIEQVLMNLVINARDAMPDGGRLSIRTRELLLDAHAAAAAGLASTGRYVVLEVSDSGSGVDPSIRDRIFEPYFTTKGSGSGLGLATVYGIVNGHGGAIEVLDRPGGGALFRVLLPALGGESVVSEPGAAAEPTRPGVGLVLMVDDDRLVRAAAARALKRLGYQVMLASDGVEAVEVYREHKAEIRCVLLDLLMPRMDGRQTYQALREIDPSVRVLITSGYADNLQVQDLIDRGVRGFVAKPYDLELLSDAIARACAT
jgi:two-component system, cell cycle sensor histidine kinase and response regulator CckA